MKFKKIICLLMSVMMVFSLCSCTTFNNFKAAFIDKTPEELKIIKIGVLEPQTGANAEKAADEIRGIEIANSIYGYVGGARIDLVYADNQSEVSLCDAAAKSLVDAGVSVILGSYNSVLTLASSDIIANSKIPAIAITNTNPLVTSTNDYYYRICCVDSYEGDAAADFILNQLQTKNVAVLYKEGNDFASGLASSFIESFEDRTEEYDAINRVTYAADTEDFSEIFFNLYCSDVDTIYFPGTLDDAKKVIQAAKDQEYTFTFVGTSKWDGIDEEGVFYTLDYDPLLPTTTAAKVLESAYKEKYGNANVPSENVALGFDAYLLAMTALGGAEDVDDKEQIKLSLEAVSNLEGATGYISMSDSGDPIKEIIIERIDAGKRIEVYTMTQRGEGR